VDNNTDDQRWLQQLLKNYRTYRSSGSCCGKQKTKQQKWQSFSHTPTSSLEGLKTIVSVQLRDPIASVMFLIYPAERP